MRFMVFLFNLITEIVLCPLTILLSSSKARVDTDDVDDKLTKSIKNNASKTKAEDNCLSLL